MSKEQIFSKSLQANKDFVESLTKEQLEKLMKPFDDYEVEQCDIHVVGVTLPLKEYNKRVDEYLNNQRNHPIERTPERMRTIEAVAYHCKRIAEELAK